MLLKFAPREAERLGVHVLCELDLAPVNGIAEFNGAGAEVSQPIPLGSGITIVEEQLDRAETEIGETELRVTDLENPAFGDAEPPSLADQR